MAAISAVVLAGGKSQRLGIDKTLLRLDGVWLLERIVEQLRTLSDDVLVVANEPYKLAPLGVPIVPDQQVGIGPLAGILAGLAATQHQVGLFVACDMPLLNRRLLRYMARLSADVDVVIPRNGSETEPLHSCYSKACVEPIAAVLEQGQRRVIHFFDRVRVRYVDPDEVAAFDPQGLSLFNINRPEDLQRAQLLLRQARQVQGAADPGAGQSARMRTLVIGYGNRDRGDDGVGLDIVQRLRGELGVQPLADGESGLERRGGGIDAVFLPQLVPQLVDLLVDYQQVVFVDAHTRPDVTGLHCAAIQPGSAVAAFAHHLGPAVLLALVERLRRQRIPAFAVSVRAYEMGFEQRLSARTATGVAPAVETILDLIDANTVGWPSDNPGKS
ncbi:MAG TPA: NTP transferase domain-containing protein [Anaerolineae bacterium]|nr:NTP transferase domain-containing protein [Anaerolineae bacterium]HQJ51163.1 NTP transferase domain-containing protein [Anaerolineae bacterium]